MSSPAKVCFNSHCKEASEQWRRGWRRRTGEYAHLCDRCGSAYEDGRFCETFHLNASGWRRCESCGKQIHCGCIVSFHRFILLDAGGIECLTCARNSYILTPNPAWPSPLNFLPSQPQRRKDLSAKTWSSIAGSDPVPWHQAPSLFNGSDIQSNVHLRMPFEIDVSGGAGKYHVYDRLSTASLEMKQDERLVNEKLRLGPPETLQNGNTELFFKEQPYHVVNDIQPVFSEISSPTLNVGMDSSSIIADDAQLVSFITESPAISIPAGKQGCCHSRLGSCGAPAICGVKAGGVLRGRNQFFPRYHPQLSVHELQQISGFSKSFITPLFEKMLSASDVGRIGRLVLPKKCAEDYFPQILQPEGLPLKVQDVKGKEWVFKFRFLPNNNGRMYVLEGITPCIQSMLLQAGDIVTFSRLDPEGKLIMSGRKSSVIPSSDHVCLHYYRGDDGAILGSDASNFQDDSARNKYRDVFSLNGHTKEKNIKDVSVIRIKRKNTSGAKSKRLRMVNEDVTDLKLTCREAQGLMRPPAKFVPSIFVVDGCELEEFEEAGPVIGRPTISGVDYFGANVQCIQCEDCFKWRKVPADALLPSRWICSENVWDLDRSQCSSAEELTKEQLEQMLPKSNKDFSNIEETAERPPDLHVALGGLDGLANLAIKGEIKCSFQNSTKHPLHKPSCACIVCHQPPNGKGFKHEQPCDCVVCSSIQRRFKNLIEMPERKQFEREPGNVHDLYESNVGNPLTSSVKWQIDLNIQPERDEDLSPGSESDGPMKCLVENIQAERLDWGGFH